MPISRLSRLLLILVALLSAACDSDFTEPQLESDHLERSAYQCENIEDGCEIPGVSGGGGDDPVDECDPYLELDGTCDDTDSCQTLQSSDGFTADALCGSGGGGTPEPGAGDGGSGGGENGASGSTLVSGDGPLDDVDDSEAVDCNSPTTAAQEFWCNGVVPTGTMKTLIESAFDQIAARGGVCEELAERGRHLLNVAMTLRVAAGTYSSSGGGTGIGAASKLGLWVVLSSSKINQYQMAGTPEWIQWLVAHELDHALGREHVAPYGPNGEAWNTVNSAQCSFEVS